MDDIVLCIVKCTYIPPCSPGKTMRLVAKNYENSKTIYISRDIQSPEDIICKCVPYDGQTLQFYFAEYGKRSGKAVLASEAYYRKAALNKKLCYFVKKGERLGYIQCVIRFQKGQGKHNYPEISDIPKHMYEIQAKVGSGAYGVVYRALDLASNNVVAIKQGIDMFRSRTDAQRCFREISILKFLDHPNIIKLIRIHGSFTEKEHIYLVMEYMPTTLYHVIRHVKLRSLQKAKILKQILDALLYLESIEVIHRDLKPENIIMDVVYQVKLCDFGMARCVELDDSWKNLDPSSEDPRTFSKFVGTRYYRAPEILEGVETYAIEVDLWSVGCILAEIYIKKLVFYGEDNYQILQCINKRLGNPTSFEGNLRSVCQLIRDPVASDLLIKILKYDPTQRIGVAEALKHEFVNYSQDSTPTTSTDRDSLRLPLLCTKQYSVAQYKQALSDVVNEYDEKEKLQRKHEIKPES